MQLTGGLPQRFADEMGALLGPDFPKDLGLAVSGGGDSMAMLHLAAGWAREFGIRLWVVTIDHGLRAESAGEAALVAFECKGLGLSHTTLKWEGWDGQGNLQDAARQARLELINRWRGGVRDVLFAHTQDDQAETFLMRLVRGSGVDGLAGMERVHLVIPLKLSIEPVKSDAGPPWTDVRDSRWRILRPLLDVSRNELRHYLDTLKIPYVDDPTNKDESYARVRMRNFLAAEGLSTERLLKTQGAMARAQEALEQREKDARKAIVTPPFVEGIVALDRDGFAQIERETQLRILSKALSDVTGAAYRPRLATLEDALERALSGGKSTLHGALIVPKKDKLFVGREFEAVRETVSPTGHGSLWDGRYLVYGPEIKGLEVRALGDAGAAAVKADRDPSLPHDLVKALPGVWDGEQLVGCRSLMWGRLYMMERR